MARPSGLARVLLLLAGAGTVAASAGPPPQQQAPPVFRGRAETVAVYTSVTDAAGQPIRTLSREHFRVLDEGRPQELTIFENGRQPITAMLLVDTSASMAVTLDLARHAAEQFVLRLLPGDRARVGSFSDVVNLSREFTDDRDSLLRSLRDDLRIGNPTRLWDAIGQTMEALAGLPGRRVIVLFTDGEDTISTTAPRDVMLRARREDVMIYAVQIRSRALPQVELQIIGPNMPRRRPQRGDPTPTQVLRSISSETGGAHFLLNPSHDVNATFTQVVDELRHQYLLGFSPGKLDGRTHELRVSVPDAPQLQVRARRYYQAPLVNNPPGRR